MIPAPPIESIPPKTNGQSVTPAEPFALPPPSTIEIGDIEFSEPCPAALLDAFSSMQGSLTNPVKNRDANIEGRDGRRGFQYSYADLAAIFDVIRQPFADNGLSVIQAPGVSQGIVSITTIIAHSSGQWMRCILKWNAGGGDFKLLGIAISYLRRYALQAMVGVAADEDRDALPEGDHKDRQPAKPAAVVSMPRQGQPANIAPPPPPAAPADEPKPAAASAAPPAPPQPVTVEDRRRELTTKIREQLGLAPAAETDLKKAIGQVYRGFISAAKTGKLPAAQENDLDAWHGCLLLLKEAIDGQLTDREKIKADPYAVGQELRKLADAAPEEPAAAAPPAAAERPDADVTEEELRRKYNNPVLDLGSWMKNTGIADRSEEEKRIFRRLAWHTNMVKIACSPRWTLAQVWERVEEKVGKPITCDPAISHDVQVAIAAAVGELNQ